MAAYNKELNEVVGFAGFSASKVAPSYVIVNSIVDTIIYMINIKENLLIN